MTKTVLMLTAIFIEFCRIMMHSLVIGIPSKYEDRSHRKLAVSMITELICWIVLIIAIWFGTNDMASDEFFYRFAGKWALTFMMLYIVFLVVIVTLIPVIFTRISCGIWKRKHCESSVVEFYSTFGNSGSVRADILSIDHIPVSQNADTKRKGETLYITPGDHQVEIGIYRLIYRRRSSRIEWSKYLETEFVFEIGQHYQIEYYEQEDEITINRITIH